MTRSGRRCWCRSLVNLGSTLLSGSQYDLERFKKEASEMLGNLRRREAEKVAV